MHNGVVACQKRSTGISQRHELKFAQDVAGFVNGRHSRDAKEALSGTLYRGGVSDREVKPDLIGELTSLGHPTENDDRHPSF